MKRFLYLKSLYFILGTFFLVSHCLGYYSINRNEYLVSERFGDIFGQEHVKKEAAKIVDMLKNYKTHDGLGAQILNVVTIRGAQMEVAENY